jgi:predicted negative regulator of RcsB-dependent stress response
VTKKPTTVASRGFLLKSWLTSTSADGVAGYDDDDPQENLPSLLKHRGQITGWHRRGQALIRREIGLRFRAAPGTLPALNMATGTTTPPATPAPTPAFDWVHLLTWFMENRRRVLLWGGGGLAVVLLTLGVIAYENRKEARASEAVSDVSVPVSLARPPAPGTVEALLKLEREHPNTKAAARAALQAAGLLFLEGRYDQAQELFARFEKTYPESPWLPQAMLGNAATLEVRGRTAEAVAEYEKLRKRYPNDAVADEVKLGLARLYEKQGRVEEAFNLYQEVIRANSFNGLGAEAGLRNEDLLQKYPQLAKTNVPPVLPATTAPTNLQARATTATNRTQTIQLTNLIRRTNVVTPTVTPTPGASNPTGTPAPLLIRPTGTTPPTPPPSAPAPAPKPPAPASAPPPK